MTGGTSAQKRKKTTPTGWPPQTQPQTTYVIGDKVPPAWGLIHKGMDSTENWTVLLYKLHESQHMISYCFSIISYIF